jgi:Rrf2 family protein
MFTKTTVSAIRALIFVAQNRTPGYLSPRRIADALGESPSYLAKVTRSLVKAGIFRAEKGVKGGVRLARLPEDVTLLAIYEACQGAILGAACQDGCDLKTVCAYHHASEELRKATVGALSNWSLEQLLRKPHGSIGKPGVPCLIPDIRPSANSPIETRGRRKVR